MRFTGGRLRRAEVPALTCLAVLLMLQLPQLGAAQTCGEAVNGTACQDGLCCSQFGFCGSSSDYCGTGCQSQCVAPAPAGPPARSTSGLDKTINESLFDALFPNRNPFYTYSSFIEAGNAYSEFGTTGNRACRRREIAAFAAHVQQETAGLVYITEIDKSGDYCDETSVEYPCAANESYYGRGPIQLSWNYNYGPASESIGEDILADPDLVAEDPVVAFKTALWFWTTAREGGIPAIHDVITGRYKPTKDDLEKGRVPGFGLTILIVNGGLECGTVTAQATNRVTYFKQFAKLLGVKPGPNLTCDKMTPYG